MPTPLTDADKVLRNDTGIDIATNIASIASALTPSNITDLGDVNLTNPITDGQVIKYDTATQKWVNGLGNITMECTQAQYDAWKQSGQLKTNTLYVITDAPNLNATAQDISYDGGADTVWDKVEAKANEHTIENVSLTCPRCPISSLSNTTAYGSGKIYYYASKIEFGATGDSTFAYLTCSLFANVDYVIGYMYDNDNDRYYSIGKGNSTSLWVFSASANRTPANTFAGKQNIYINLIGIKL